MNWIIEGAIIAPNKKAFFWDQKISNKKIAIFLFKQLKKDQKLNKGLWPTFKNGQIKVWLFEDSVVKNEYIRKAIKKFERKIK